jgi:hypothetical protein
MGGDAAINSADSWLQAASMRPKIWKEEGLLVGVGGKQRISQLIRQFRAPEIIGDAFDYLLNDYLPELISGLDGERVIKTNIEDGMVCMDATILIALLGRLFKIDSIGANNEVALGVLYAFKTSLIGAPRSQIEVALGAVLHHCASIREPFTILEI